MPFASVGVMGTSCWTYSWAGIAVQWVCLEHAASLLELAAVDDHYEASKTYCSSRSTIPTQRLPTSPSAADARKPPLPRQVNG
jgi:hypothetical protein